MDIAIDVSTTLNHGHDIGGGRYIYNLVKNLVEIDDNNSYILTARVVTDKYLGLFDDMIGDPGKKVSKKYFITTQKKLDRWDRFKFPTIEFKGLKADMLHCPDYIIAPTKNKNIVLTIHDLGFLRFPEFNFKWFIEKYSKMVERNSKVAKRIIADSESTRDDIIKYLGVDKDKTAVVPLASDPVFRMLDQKEKDTSVLEKFGTGKDFILSVGTIEPRKNFPALIKAFNKKKEGPYEDIKLVIVGRTGWKSEKTFKAREESPYKEDILFIGWIDDSELVQLYNQALLFAYPTVFEGFGLPVLEAMSCGCPVISTDTSSIPEIIINSKYLVEVDNIKELSDKISQVIDDKDLRERMIKFSLERSRTFSWKETAKKTLDIYESLF